MKKMIDHLSLSFFFSSSLCFTFQELFIYSLRNREIKKNKISIESVGIDHWNCHNSFLSMVKIETSRYNKWYRKCTQFDKSFKSGGDFSTENLRIIFYLYFQKRKNKTRTNQNMMHRVAKPSRSFEEQRHCSQFKLIQFQISRFQCALYQRYVR